ncbi:MAG: WG repeat-containing protein [Oscillospiraceae bacterium]
MRKRLLPVLLALLLLLTACGGGADSGPASSDPTPAPEATPEPAPESTPAPTAGASWQVQTDYSHYTPYEAPTAQYTRLREEWIGALEPSDGYGMLYPFLGTRLHSESNGRIYEEGALYGLFDENGRIVVDPVYSEIRFLSYYDSYAGESVQVPMLLLGRGDSEKMVYAIASPDGSFVTDCCYGYVRTTAFGVLCAESFESEEFVLYGFDGRVLLTEKELKLGESKLLWGASSLSGGDSDLLLAELDSGCCYVNLNGRLVGGPYEYGDIFSGGYANVQERSKWGVIDTSGNWVVPAAYRSVRRGHDGAFVAQGDGFTVFDPSGRELFRLPGNYLSVTDYGYNVDGTCYLKDGSLAAFSGQDWLDSDGPILHRSTADGNLELMNWRSGQTLTLEGEYYVSAVWVNWVMGPVSSLEYVYCYTLPGQEAVPCLVSWDLERIFPLENSAELAMGGVSALCDEVTGEEYLVAYDPAGGRTIYTAELEELLTSSQSVRVYNGRFLIIGDQCFTCTDLEGNVLFRYSLILPDGD